MIGFKNGKVVEPSLSTWARIATAISLGVITVTTIIFAASGVLLLLADGKVT